VTVVREGNERVREQLSRWRDDLLDLTGRNRLLRFRHTKTSSLEIDSPGAPEILDRLLMGRSREWSVFIPEEEPAQAEFDPTAARVGLGPADRRGSAAEPVMDALQRLGVTASGDRVWLSLGALRWHHNGAHVAALLLVPAEVEQRSGWRLRLRTQEMLVNPALVGHFDTEFEFDLGEQRYRIESAGVQSYLDTLRTAFGVLDAEVDDRIGLISDQQHAAMLDGQLDVTPAVLISDTPREGALAGLAGSADEGLPLLPPKSRVLGLPMPKAAKSGPVLRTTKTNAKDVRAACASLSRRATQEFMDKGLWILYLGVGMLHWSDPADGRAEVQDSPLLLIPVRLEPGKRGAEWKLLPTEDEALLNPALWLTLATDLGIELPDLDPEESIDAANLLAKIRAAVEDRFGWTVEERVVLSTFSFHKEAMYRDLRDNFEQIASHPMIEALAREPGLETAGSDFDFEPVDESRLDAVFPPEQATTILDADSSQRQCLASAGEGRSFVMDGPPGTGKSQTIANMIAELIADGKTVLFVSEKAAALDVVHNRLAHVGLDEYVLELHSHKTTRSAVATALGASLLRRPKPNPALSDRDLHEAQRRRDELSRYATALNDPLDALGGRSLHHLLGWIAALQHLPQAPVAKRPPSGTEEISTIRELGERLRSTWEVVERGEDFEWRGAAATNWGAAVEQRVQSAIAALEGRRTALRTVAEAVAEDLLLEPPTGPAAAAELAGVLEHLRVRPDEVLSGWLTGIDPGRLEQIARRTMTRQRRWQGARAVGEPILGDRWRTIDEPAVVGIQQTLRDHRISLAEDVRATDLQRLATAADRMAEAADELRPLGADLAALHGLASAELSLGDAEAAVKLSAIPREACLPPTAWLATEGATEEAAVAVSRLAPLLRAALAAREEASIFDDAVLDLALPALASRFKEQHKGVKKLGGAYRADRDALAGTAPTVKAKQAIAAIDQAIAWQTARLALDAAAGADASKLSTAWSGPGTDADELERRLALAKSAAHLAGDRIADRSRFADTMSGARPAPGTLHGATRADGAIARLRADCPDELRTVLDLPLDRAATDLRGASVALRDLAAVTERVDAARGSAGSAVGAVAVSQAARVAANVEVELAGDIDATQVLESWARMDADPDLLQAAIEWGLELREMLAESPSKAAARRLVVAEGEQSGLRDALNGWRTALDLLLVEFHVDRRPELAGDLEAHFDDAEELLARLRETRGDIETWIAHDQAVGMLRSAGLEDAVAYCNDQRVPAGQVVDILRRSALEALADELLAARSEALGPLRSIDRDRLVREYAGADRNVISDAAHRVMRAANGRRPNAVLGVASIIANEAQKKKRHMPVSQLLAKTAPVAQAVKPCFMMSPLSVSQFLAPTMQFDVVIFDEASQVRPCDAINALYRGRAMIVAGDPKQLPPTSFFEQTTDDGDEWTEDALSDYDSVLELAKSAGTIRSLSLRWHYRSRHEHLIAFSNHRFYGGDLVTFPSPADETDDLGVQLIHVEGVYRRGTSRDNPAEAQAVAERIFWHAERGARSIGVVAFSEAQASLIEAVLRQDDRRDDPRFNALFTGDRLDGLFIKNLENVQGDERDIIIFSVGYGPDEHDKLTMNFGPLIREGGWRRLNVAITRARNRVEIICSFAPERLASGSRNRGVDELRRYLEFAARGPAALAIDDALDEGGEPESPFEEAVLRTIRTWGYEVVSQVGTAGYRVDMAVRHPQRPGHFALGIECDGAMYHSSRVARDRDRLREQVLVGLGWTLHRIWGPSWYRDRSGEERRLKEAIQRAILAPPDQRTATHDQRPSPVVVDFEDLVLDAPPNWAEPYVAAVLPMGRAADPAEPEAIGELRRLILQTVTEEAPIVEDLIARRVIGAWGSMLSEKRRAVIRRALDGFVSAGTLVRRGNAFCLPNQPTDLVRVPQEGDERTEREVRHVPDVELAEAVARLVAEARVVTEEEAQQKAARLFGWRRNGPAIQAALMRIVEQLADEGRVEREGGQLRMGRDTRSV
jgi:very-short-patch-repair endonuclease